MALSGNPVFTDVLNQTSFQMVGVNIAI